MKYIVSDKLRPPPTWYGDTWERGPSPWHKDAVPSPAFSEEIRAAFDGGERKMGWFAIDGVGNAIGFVQDGHEVEVTPMQMLKMPKDLVDELMRQGADVAINTGLYEKGTT